MRFLFFLLCLLFLSACTPETPVLEEEPPVSEKNISIVSENISPYSSPASLGYMLTPERQRLREARLTVDFRLLTSENCDAFQELHAKNISVVRDYWENLREDLDQQEKKAADLSEKLRAEQQGSARWEALKQDYDDLQEEIDVIEDDLEELERLQGNMAFTLHEMEEECLVLKKHKS
ncbi:MAG: hypothetical protein AABX86_01890 [Nanoarchaeota archaeon]